jgi:hypothetical protein
MKSGNGSSAIGGWTIGPATGPAYVLFTKASDSGNLPVRQSGQVERDHAMLAALIFVSVAAFGLYYVSYDL